MTLTSNSNPLLRVEDLQSQFWSDTGVVRAVDHVSFDVVKGEVLGLVGESGCGKSATSLSILRLLPKPYGRIVGGKVLLDGTNLVDLSEADMRRVRGNRIAMIFQDPMSSLNPYLRVAEQLCEAAELHLGLDRKQALVRAIGLLERVGIPDAPRRIHDYPHQLSGGMRQRVMIAMALLCDPELLIADEPTTALDVTIQAQILALMLELCRERELSIILITHDLGVVASICDRVVVMYAGRVVESAPAAAIFEQPAHPYTRALLKSVPRVEARGTRLWSIQGLPPRLDQGPFQACAFAPRCALVQPECHAGEPELEALAPGHLRRCILPVEALKEMTLLSASDVCIGFNTPRGRLRAVDGVNLEVGASETVALVGESGCGKSTLAKGIVGLEPLAGGSLVFQGKPLDHQRERVRLARQLQMVFQDPDASLNPRLTLNQALKEPLRIHGIVPRSEEEAAVCDLLSRVGIDPVLRNRYPHELSGGQKQRVCIARALAVKPKLLILDEAVSALDVSVRAQILNLLADLRKDLGLAYLFITHDLGVVRQFADRVYVMYLGQMVEVAHVEALFSQPEHPYTQALLASVPRLEVGSFQRDRVLLGDVPSPLNPPAGCRFHTRCPKVFDTCKQTPPPIVALEQRVVRCWLHAEQSSATVGESNTSVEGKD